ncbi:hypothetical protein EDD21DRAFT_358538 [Dissophora ornata]|nr:hypothetical protein EDD21DRAFT_358538 [Dissophora ornata]
MMLTVLTNSSRRYYRLLPTTNHHVESACNAYDFCVDCYLILHHHYPDPDPDPALWTCRGRDHGHGHGHGHDPDPWTCSSSSSSSPACSYPLHPHLLRNRILVRTFSTSCDETILQSKKLWMKTGDGDIIDEDGAVVGRDDVDADRFLTPEEAMGVAGAGGVEANGVVAWDPETPFTFGEWFAPFDPCAASNAAGSKLDPILDKMLGLIGAELAFDPNNELPAVPCDEKVVGVLECSCAIWLGVPVSVMLDFRDTGFGLTTDPDKFVRRPLLADGPKALSFGGYDTVDSGELEKDSFLDPPATNDERPPVESGSGMA